MAAEASSRLCGVRASRRLSAASRSPVLFTIGWSTGALLSNLGNRKVCLAADNCVGGGWRKGNQGAAASSYTGVDHRAQDLAALWTRPEVKPRRAPTAPATPPRPHGP